ncbi:unnamed protein product [Adineta steineri]|uniref:Uncharacterized protein n=1 Tax=Adineta steineri TaxID=433720 RepID=A0A819ICT2_9BILA|nr:unnamed protein product [Adineta steineri]
MGNKFNSSNSTNSRRMSKNIDEKIREEKEFYEIDLDNFKLKLTQITEEFLRSSNISIRQDSQEFIKKISVVSPFDFLSAGSSLFFVFVDLERELQTKSTRTLLFSCTTDKCNNQTSLQRILNALALEENFQPFDILFNNNSKPFTEQNSRTDFSNSTHFECPTSGCFLSEMESIREVCARCPKELPTLDLDFLNRRIFFFLENSTRLVDKSTLVCRTKGCNALDNVKKIHHLNKMEFDFNKF